MESTNKINDYLLDYKNNYLANYKMIIELNKKIYDLKNQKERVIHKYEKWLRDVISKHYAVNKYQKIRFELQHPLDSELEQLEKGSKSFITVELIADCEERKELIDRYKIPIKDLLKLNLDIKLFSESYKEDQDNNLALEKKKDELMKLSKEELVNIALKRA